MIETVLVAFAPLKCLPRQTIFSTGFDTSGVVAPERTFLTFSQGDGSSQNVTWAPPDLHSVLAASKNAHWSRDQRFRITQLDFADQVFLLHSPNGADACHCR